jgi:tetratricopeptide (TPR) repeat protein
MADLFPTDPKRIRERIRRYERALKKELESGYGGDGYGKRFLLGPLYMLMGDVDGALASFDWYEKAYPDDGGEPYQYLTWALALFRGDRRQEAFNKLYQTMLENLYLVPFLLGRNPQPLDIWHGSNLGWIEYAVEIPRELLSLWDDVALQWAREVSKNPVVVEKVARYVAIHRELKSEPRGPRRTALVNEAFALKKTAIPLN